MILSAIKLLLIGIYTVFLSIVAMISILVDRSYWSYFVLTKIFSSGVLFLSGVKLKVNGLENFDTSKKYVFVSNHSSMFDIPALQLAFPNRVAIVFKKELTKIPLFGWQLAIGPYIMIDRQRPDEAMKSIQLAKERMEKKNLSVVLFAEGTRSKTGEVQPFKRGAFYLASRVGYDIIPVSISGAARLLPKGTFNIKTGTITVHFDQPIPTTEIKNKVDEVKLMESVRDIVIKNKTDL
ncbi:MAG: 1-acyl-sn-glycerol-3-phosphate acyltransferase [Ignavibacteriaceae bacterium]|nr:1-acyl-sn-glycerol-3-phosphate acyltransferase [Ignavibacteriaceae bacterium]